MPLYGRKIFITGGTRGLGRAMALEFAARRAEVCLTGRSADEAAEVARSTLAALKEENPDAGEPRILGVPCEVTSLESVVEAVKRATGELGGITDVVANAGEAGRFGRFDHLTPEEWRHTVEVNLFGTFHTFYTCLQPILDAGGGSLVGVSGYGAIRALPFVSPYSVGKAGLVQLVRVLAKEFAVHPLRFLVLSPGILDFGLTKGIACTPEDAHHFHNPFQKALRGYLRKPVGDAARLAASLLDPANPVPSGSKISLHKPFEVSWAMARARLKVLRGG